MDEWSGAPDEANTIAVDWRRFAIDHSRRFGRTGKSYEPAEETEKIVSKDLSMPDLIDEVVAESYGTARASAKISPTRDV